MLLRAVWEIVSVEKNIKLFIFPNVDVCCLEYTAIWKLTVTTDVFISV